MVRNICWLRYAVYIGVSVYFLVTIGSVDFGIGVASRNDWKNLARFIPLFVAYLGCVDAFFMFAQLLFKKFSKKVIYVFIVIIIALLPIISFSFGLQKSIMIEKATQEKGDIIALKISEYYNKNGKFPDTLQDVNELTLSMLKTEFQGSSFFYQVFEDKTNAVIGFNTINSDLSEDSISYECERFVVVTNDLEKREPQWVCGSDV